jgi:hypothetical protein
MNKIITVDCDDVLSETVDALLKYYDYNIKWCPIKREDITFHEFDKIKKYHYSFDDRIDKDMDFFLHKDSSHLIKPLLWSLNKLNEFKKAWYKIYVVTGRPDELKNHTLDWLNINYKDMFNNVYFTNADKANAVLKSDFCVKLWSKLMIEDDLRFARDIASKWIKVYLLDKPWNKDYNVDDKKLWIIKIYNWTQVDVDMIGKIV